MCRSNKTRISAFKTNPPIADSVQPSGPTPRNVAEDYLWKLGDALAAFPKNGGRVHKVNTSSASKSFRILQPRSLNAELRQKQGAAASQPPFLDGRDTL